MQLAAPPAWRHMMTAPWAREFAAYDRPLVCDWPTDRRRAGLLLCWYGRRGRDHAASRALHDDPRPGWRRCRRRRSERHYGLSMGRGLRWLDRRAALSTQDGLRRDAGCQHRVEFRDLGSQGRPELSLQPEGDAERHRR